MKRIGFASVLTFTLVELQLLAVQELEFVPLRSGLEPRMSLSVDQRRGQIRFEWTRSGRFQSAPSVEGPWSLVEGVRGVRYTLPLSEATETMMYFRVLPSEDGPTRPATLQVPDGYNENTRYPLILNLHPFDGDPAELEERALPLAHLVDSRSFLYCTPFGHPEAGTPAPGFVNPLGWNATDACCKTPAEQERIDDVSYLSSLVDWIQENYSVNPLMIYAAGASNGGSMVHRLLCDRSDVFAAGVSHAGTLWKDESLCQPTEPVSILQIHSLNDEVIGYQGGAVLGVYPGVIEMLSDWAEILGCSGELSETEQDLDLDLSFAAEGRETQVFRYTNCDGVDVELWRKSAGLHRPTVRRDGRISELPEAVLDWLFDHPKRK